MPQLTSTPTPDAKSVELVRQAGEIVSIWNTLTPVMAVLLVALVALGIVALVVWLGRGNSSAALNVIVKTNAEKEREIADLKAYQAKKDEQFVNGLMTIAEQSTRSNDLFEAMNNRGLERDKQQQRMVETQEKISTAFETLLHEGSTPLQKVASDVAAIMGTIAGMNTRTENWQTVMDSIPQIRADFNERLDSLFKELAKRSTKPIPVVAIDIQPEVNPP
jgi:hypothetical protein